MHLYKLIVESGAMKKVACNFGISQISNKSKPDVKINLRYFAIRYDRDEIVEF